eukprot:GHVL01033131.1.p1 GENE.GHVL01033131.1~~GHVL01033131.1.p1  ORF type:complete len:576 (+),score=46.75 GHVL01033131.1:1534-3261(+)
MLAYPGSPGMLEPEEEEELPGMLGAYNQRAQYPRQQISQSRIQPPLDSFTPPLSFLQSIVAGIPSYHDPMTRQVDPGSVQEMLTGTVDTVLPAGLGAMAWQAMKGRSSVGAAPSKYMSPAERTFNETHERFLSQLDDVAQEQAGWQRQIDALSGRPSGRPEARGDSVLPPLSGQLGGPAFHGSPHRFDKFDIDKIGTGEGAQAYGHGLYFAESPGVARSYQRIGDAGDLVIRREGKIIARGNEIGDEVLEASKFLDLGRKRAGQFPHNTAYYAKQIADEAAEGLPGAAKRHARTKQIIDEYADASFAYEPNPGTLYEVDIPDEQIAQMLDWDKPLSEQPEMVKRLRAIADEHPIVADSLQDFELNNSTGASIYSALQDDMRRAAPLQNLDTAYVHAAKDFMANDMDPIEGLMSAYQGITPNQAQAAVITARGGYAAEASRQLREAGIPGIRYLDQASRDAGKGTRNLVLFSDENINILKRDGKAVPLPSKQMKVKVGGKNVTVLQNPTLQDRGNFTAGVRADKGIDKVSTRQTLDADGNVWVWDADDTIHDWMEPELSKAVGRPVNQNQSMLEPR